MYILNFNVYYKNENYTFIFYFTIVFLRLMIVYSCHFQMPYFEVVAANDSELATSHHL